MILMSRLAKLAEMLQSEPNDPFLNYAFALETSKDDRPAALNLLAEMNAKFPDHIPAFFRHGQLLAEAGDAIQARQILSLGIQVARRLGDDHAAAEMHELLESL
jgi:predicted Zn-dependent protease